MTCSSLKLTPFNFLFFISLILVLMPPLAQEAKAQDTLFPYSTSFVISAYYSPCEGQSHYVTGSYESDIRLNGSGVHGADGTSVYPGMIAAPKIYPFGTKLSIPGIGIVAVHDRGGAIVQAGVRGHLYDRLDVWMGYCDPGLSRALNWGVRTVNNVLVYGVDDSITESVYLEGFSFSEAVVKNIIFAPQLFPQDIWYLSTSDDVKRLQQTLTDLNYYHGTISGFYGDETKDAVYQFQKDQNIIDSPDDWGAGHTGTNTRKALDLAVAKLKETQEQNNQKEEQITPNHLDKYPDLPQAKAIFSESLQRGSRGEIVKKLQEELASLGFLRIDPQSYGYFGEITEHAIFKFQQKMGIITNKESAGAGQMGPQTLARLNEVINARTTQMNLIALHRDEQQSSPSSAIAQNVFFTRELAPGDRGEDVKALQELLKKLGFFKGAFLTPFYGEQTKNAVAAFQKANQLISKSTNAGIGYVKDETKNLLNSLI